MNKKTMHLCLFAISLLPLLTFSQSLSIGIGGGVIFLQRPSFYTNAIGPPGVYLVDGVQSQFEGLGMRNELQLSGFIDYRLPQSPLAMTLQLNYLFLRGHGNSYQIDYALQRAIPATVTTKNDLLTIALATSYYFDDGQLSPFLSVNVQLNGFDDASARYDTPGDWAEYKTYERGIRFGFGVGPGIDIYVMSGATLRILSAYNIHNAFGRNGGEEQMHSLSFASVFLYNISL